MQVTTNPEMLALYQQTGKRSCGYCDRDATCFAREGARWLPLCDECADAIDDE